MSTDQLRRTRPTIRAVAERAEVAISTVSRVLNGGAASRRIRRKVQRAIDELGYAPSVAAQSLGRGRTGSIGLAGKSSVDPWFVDVLAGVEEALAPTRNSVLLASTMLTGSYDASAPIGWVRDNRIDGLLLVRHAEEDQPLLSAAKDAGLPIVLVAPDVDTPDESNVRCNNVAAGRLAAAHLVELGHRRIAFVGGPQGSLDTRLRLFGLEDTLRGFDPDLAPFDVLFTTGYVPSGGIEYAERFLSLPPAKRPTAVVLANDPMALGFMRVVLSAGVSVPDDVSVVGFDDTSGAGLCWPGLTTIHQPTRQMAADACVTLLRCLEEGGPIRVATTEYPVRLVVRESTGRARSS